jgi:hypothetical protein
VLGHIALTFTSLVDGGILKGRLRRELSTESQGENESTNDDCLGAKVVVAADQRYATSEATTRNAVLVTDVHTLDSDVTTSALSLVYQNSPNNNSITFTTHSP